MEESSYDELKSELNRHSTGDLVVCSADVNGHIGRQIDAFDGVHAGYGQRNSEGRMLSELCLEKELCVSNRWCKKEEKMKVTFKIGENEKKLTLC